MYFSGIADEAGKPLEAQIRAHRELGWDHIEIRTIDGTGLTYVSDDEFAAIHEALNDAGLQVSCFAGSIANWARDIHGPFEKDVDELRRSIPRMRKMGTEFIRVMSYANESAVDDAEWRREAIRRFAELARMAEDAGVVMVHENCTGYGGKGPAETLDLLAEVNSPAFKLVFDTGNTIAYGQNAWDYYAAVKDHIVYVHIKDMRSEGEEPVACFAGEGEADVRRILTDLFASGYDGGISIEPHMTAQAHLGTESAPELMYETYVEYGRRIVALVEEIRNA